MMEWADPDFHRSNNQRLPSRGQYGGIEAYNIRTALEYVRDRVDLHLLLILEPPNARQSCRL